MIKRGKPAVDESTIAAFWAWWHGGADERALAFPPSEEFVDEITARVTSIHPRLVWHHAGATATDRLHTLIVGSEGDATARAAAEAWLRAAPVGDKRWAFLASRPADPDPLHGRFRFGRIDLDLAEVRFLVVDQPGGRHDITVMHPQFSELDPQARLQVSFHALDLTVGEDLVERWIGAIDAAATNRPGGVTAQEFARRIADDEAQRDPAMWAIAQGHLGKGDRVWLVRAHLDRFDFPTFDTHHVIEVKYARTANGLPAKEALQKMQDAEDIFESLGESIVHVATVTGGRWRVVHLYSDGSPDAEASVKQLARQLKRSAKTHYDPWWRALRGLQPRG